MKILSDKEINEFLEEAKVAIEKYATNKNVDACHSQWIINEIKNINNISKHDVLDNMKYFSYSSNYFEPVSILIKALEKRLEYD